MFQRTLCALGASLLFKLMDANDLAIQSDTLYFARSLSGCGAIFSLPAR
jgi:hypothetical protein